MPSGKVKWFNNAKGYGFIIEDGCSDDLFVHFSSVQMDGYKTLKAGQRVSFDKKPSEKGIHAVNIIPGVQASKESREAGSSTQEQKTSETTEENRQNRSSRAANG